MATFNINILKGNVIYTPKFGELKVVKHGYIVVQDNKVVGVYESLPKEYNSLEIHDYGDKIIIPGFVDLHFHAPQLSNRGLGMDKELLPWLESYTFPEEAKYSNLDYAEKAYKKVVKELWKYGTTRSVLFGTIHKDSTNILMDFLDKAGLGAYVGKVNMDRNSPDFYIEETSKSLKDTEEWLEETHNKYDMVKPIITPRFVPTCTSDLMKGLGELARKYNVPVQSHLSENQGEIDWVSNLHPESSFYGEVYNNYGLFGHQPTIMAHCVHGNDDEIELMAKNNVYVAHSPHSNNNLSSGIAPIRKLVEKGIPVGLASDISGGHAVSMTSVMAAAAQVSRLKWLEMNKEYEALSTPELLYLATKGGGSFFGKVGSFEEGYEFDALVIDDESLKDLNQRTLEERLERYIYIGDDRNIIERYVAGKRIEEPNF